MDAETAKRKIQQLVEKYEEVLTSGKLKGYTEQETKNGFIEPLFNILGWDTTNKNEVSLEEQISGDRADYGFYLGGRPKFYLEAKKLSADLWKEEFANQCIRYSWNKGVTWAVLTDFENIKIFCAQVIDKDLSDKLLFDIPYKQLVEKFDQLYLLSKEAFEKELLDEYATKFGKKLQKVSVGVKLYEDLNECRQLLTKDLHVWNEKVSDDLLDEGVQKILDRLIFIRVAEDRGVEQSTLKPMINQWEAGGKKGNLYESMIGKFRELDKVYDSGLFGEHPFEKWEDYSDATKNVVKILYGKEGYYEYDFKVMPADVLGGVYESYLGHRLQKAKKGLTIGKDAKKRKEQGIYYTPEFIVDYIVKNALKPVLDKCASVNDLKKIKVLDPACGSGSFLLKAVEMISDKYKEFGNNSEFTKLTILLENIYGVDLDKQAVEIARLNLLINALDKRMELPVLKNIRNGNSLISGTDEELKKYFGANFRDKKPFNWQEEFPEVFTQGGFDVIIGNPPYIKEDVSREAFDGLHNSPYYQGKMDLWTMFACVSVDLLKNNGTMGFIAPSSWITNMGASIMRNKMLTDGQLKTFIDFGDYKVFEQAGIQTMIFIFEKKKPEEKYKIDYLKIADKNITENKLIADIAGEKAKIEIEPEKLKNGFLVFNESGKDIILNKIKSKSNYIIDEKDVGNGIDVLQDFVSQKHLLELSDKTIKKGDGVFVLSEDEVKEVSPTKNEFFYLRPYYTTAEINRYLATKNTNHKIIYADGYFREHIEEFPNLKKHLDKFSKILTSAYAPYGLHRAREEKFFNGDCIFSIRKTKKPAFSLVSFPCYVTRAFMVLKLGKINPKYVLGLLNSQLMYFWLKNRGKLQGDQLQIDKEPLLDLPIYVGSEGQQKQIIILVDKMLELNEEFQKAEENSDKWHSIKSEIEKTDKKIDEEVYKLYGLTEEEIKIIEK